MRNGLAVGTIVARNYLAYARVLNHSLRRHHPEVPHYVLVVDETSDDVTGHGEAFHRLRLADLQIPDVKPLLFGYELKPLLCALKATLLRYLLGAGFASALYLDADMWILDDLAPVFEQVSSHALSLTPHIGIAPTQLDRRMLERMLLLAGIYNAGFVGAAGTAETHRFLAWWEMRLRHHCDEDLRRGIHCDQRWLDLAPGFVGDLHIVRDPGVNVAYWNLPEADAAMNGEHFSVNGHPCRLFHFSGFDPDIPERATCYLPDWSLRDVGAAAPLFERYRQQLKAAGHDDCKHLLWRWDHFSNGVAITRKERRRYRAMGDAARRYGDPFDAASRSSYYRSQRGPGFRARRLLEKLRRRKRRRAQPGGDATWTSTPPAS